jgi:hypothetical protein
MKLTATFASLLLLSLSQLTDTAISSPIPESKPLARADSWDPARVDIREIGVRATMPEYALVDDGVPAPSIDGTARGGQDSVIDWDRYVHELGVRATLMEYRRDAKEPGEGTTAWFKRAPTPGFITVDGVPVSVG